MSSKSGIEDFEARKEIVALEEYMEKKEKAKREDREIKENIIRQILEREWDFFQRVNHTEGRADCQDNYEEFVTMRESQWCVLPLTVLRSYLDDLIIAFHNDRNPLMEKYTRMMEYSAPDEFHEISGFLPEISSEKKKMVKEVLRIYLKWEKEVMGKYPKLAGRGRPLYSIDDTPNFTSIETYLRGELLSYSLKTVELYLEYINECSTKGINLAERNLEEIIRKKGYKSLEEAEISVKVDKKD